MTLIEMAGRNLFRRPLRTVLSALGIALAVASAITLLALSRSVNESVTASVDERGSDLTVMQRGATDLFGGFLPQAHEARIAALPGVTGVAAELLMFAPVDAGKEVLVTGWPPTSFFWKTAPLKSGRRPAPGEVRVALIGDAAAEALGKGLGDTLEIEGVVFKVVGITAYASAINRRMAIVPVADLQQAAYRSGQVTLFQVSVRPGMSPADLDQLRARIETLAPLSASLTSEMMSNNRYVAILNAISLATTVIALAVGVLNVLNTLIFTIQERTREIGILAAVGWDDRRIMASIVTEGLILCLLGCVGGVILGYAASFSFGAIPSVGAYLSFTPTPDLILLTLAATVLLCLAGSVYPAWRAVQMTPAQALRRV